MWRGPLSGNQRPSLYLASSLPWIWTWRRKKMQAWRLGSQATRSVASPLGAMVLQEVLGREGKCIRWAPYRYLFRLNLENARYWCSRSSVQQLHRPVYRNSIHLQRADNPSPTQIAGRLTTVGPICCQPSGCLQQGAKDGSRSWGVLGFSE